MKKSFERAQRRREDGAVYKHDLGQHFLYDEGLLEELVNSTGVTQEQGVLEIGPGGGAMTRYLCQKAGRVVAVEADESILPFLRLKTQDYANLTLVQGDIRRQNLRELCASLGKDFFVIANLPYNITTPVLDMLWESGLPIRQMSLMVQKEVAEKLMAAPSTPSYCLTSVRCQYYCRPQVERIVPAECFTPPPKVDSAFIHLPTRSEPPLPVTDERLLFSMLKAGFGMRRKTLLNALKGVADTEKLKRALDDLNLSPTIRGEALGIENWIQLSNACG